MSATSGRSSSDPRASVPAEPEIVAALYRISSLVGRIEAPDEALPQILDEIAALFAAESAVLALVNPDTGALEIEYTRGFPDEHRDAEIPGAVGLIGWSAFHQRAVVVGDVALDPRHVPLRRATRATMVAPVEIDGQLHGAFALDADRAHAFDDAHLSVLVRVTTEAASVMQRLWLIEHLRRKAAQLEVLGNVAQEVAGKLQPDELMEVLTRESHRLANCRLAMLQIHDAGRGAVQLRSVYPPGDYHDGGAREWEIHDSLAGASIRTRKQVEHANIRLPEYIDLRDVPARVDIASVLCTPLIADLQVIGVLSVFTERPHRFANDERRLLKALANLAAVSLQNAQLYQRVFESEESLRQSERLTTLGLLAAEIAHETRNPLTVIRLLFGSLNLEFGEGDPRATDIAIIREKLDQLEAFVSRVLSLAKAPESLHARWPLDDLIRETCLLLRLKLHQARIHLRYEPPAEPVVVDCHKGQIQQVLLNVILNATQAMPDGGAITIVCRRQQGAVHDTALVEITDTGHGIPREYQDRIFESFLSGRAGGTGLGLSIAKRIMRSHHGDIEVAATSSAGTTMRISLPVAP